MSKKEDKEPKIGALSQIDQEYICIYIPQSDLKADN